jgi:hypothetical protein
VRADSGVWAFRFRCSPPGFCYNVPEIRKPRREIQYQHRQKEGFYLLAHSAFFHCLGEEIGKQDLVGENVVFAETSQENVAGTRAAEN